MGTEHWVIMNMIQCSVILVLARVMLKYKCYARLHLLHAIGSWWSFKVWNPPFRISLELHLFLGSKIWNLQRSQLSKRNQAERCPPAPYEKLGRWPYVTVAHGTSRLWFLPGGYRWVKSREALSWWGELSWIFFEGGLTFPRWHQKAPKPKLEKDRSSPCQNQANVKSHKFWRMFGVQNVYQRWTTINIIYIYQVNSKIKYQTLYRTQNDNENVLGIFQFAKSCFFSMTRNFIGIIFASQLICLAGRYAPGGRPSFYRRLLHHWTSQLHAASAFGVWLLSVLLRSVFHDLGTDFPKHRWPTQVTFVFEKQSWNTNRNINDSWQISKDGHDCAVPSVGTELPRAT